MDNEIENLKKQIEDLQNKLQDQSPTQGTHAPLNIEEADEYTWEAPIRVFTKWDRRKIVTMLAWSAIPALILLYLHEFILLVTAILLVLVGIALVTIPPSKTVHKITNKGIKSYNKHYLWEDLHDFWIGTKGTTIILYIHTKLIYPANLMFIVPRENLSGLVEVLSRHLKYREIREQQGMLSRWTDGIYVKYNDLHSLEASNDLA